MEALRIFLGLTLGGIGGFEGRAGEGHFQKWKPEHGGRELSGTRNARASRAKRVSEEHAVVVTEAKAGVGRSVPALDILCRMVSRKA